MAKFLTLFLAVLITGSQSHASKEGGNGGGAIVCTAGGTPGGDIISAEVLDLFEARAIRGLQSDLGDPKEDYSLKIERVLKALERVSPIRAKKYRDLYKTFFQETRMVRDVDMIYISDALNPVIPKGCKMQQVAIQQPPEFPGDPRYIIDENLWDKLDSNSKAALIIHEIFYNEGIFLGHQNSKAVRYMTGIVTSTRMRKISQAEFAKLIFVSNFVAADMFGTMLTKTNDYSDTFTLETDGSTYFASYLPNEVKIGYLHFGRDVYINLSKKHARPTSALYVTSFKKRNIEGRSEPGGNLALTFDEHGKVVEIGVQSKPANIRGLNWEIKAESGVRIQLGNEMPRKVSGTIQVRNKIRNYDSGKVEMYSTTDDAPNIDSVGVILKRLITTPTILKTPQGDRLFHGDSGYRYSVAFTSDGNVTSGLLAKGEKIETEKGHFITNGLCAVTYLQNGLASVNENCFLIEVK